MAYADVVTGRAGFVEYGLLVHGIPYLFVTGGAWESPVTIAGIVGDLTPVPYLRLGQSGRGFEESLEVDPKEWALTAANLTFSIVDGMDPETGAPHLLTRLFGRKVGGVASARLVATAAPSDTTFQVDDASVFTAPLDLYRGLETVGCDTVDTGVSPDELQDLTRGKYGSTATEHRYRAVSEGHPEIGLSPLITDGVTSLYGRSVTLYIRHANAVGTGDYWFDDPEVRYRGRIMGSVVVDGPEWAIATENAWTAIDSKVLPVVPTTQITGIAFGRDQLINWSLANGGQADTATITTHTFDDGVAFARLVVEAINAQIRTGGGNASLTITDTGVPGRARWAIEDDANDTDEVLILTFTTPESGYVLGFVEGLEGVVAEPVRDLGFQYFVYEFDVVPALHVTTDVVQAGILPAEAFAPLVVPVVDATLFDAFQDVGADGDANWELRAMVWIGEYGYSLFDVDTGATPNTITIQNSVGAYFGMQGVPVQYYGDPRVEVRQYLHMEADPWWRGWQALVESTAVSADTRGFVDTNYFDWDGIAAAAELAVKVRTMREVTEPSSLRAMMLEDMSLRGILPTISAGKVSGLVLRAPGEVDAILAVDRNVVLEQVMLRSTYSRERIINRIVYRWRWSVTDKQFEGPDLNVNFGDSIQDNGDAGERVVENRAVTWQTEADAAPSIFASAWSYLQLFGSDYAVIEVPVTLRAGLLVPGDVVNLTDESTPDPATGDRGATSMPCLVLGVKMTPISDQPGSGARGTLTVLAVTDGRRRSGFAPAARVDTYTDNGGGAGASRYQLLVDAGFYSLPATNEATYFLAGMKVVLMQRDTTSPTVEAFTVTAAGNDGTSVYVDAAPSAPMQAIITAGKALLKFNKYDTAAQTAAAKAYLHVCDEDDGLIGASGDAGFSPS